MGSPSLYQSPTIMRLFKLIDQVREGQILLPRFQRPFVWEDPKRLDLLDSVRRGMPIGSLLVWQTEKHALTCHTNHCGWAVGAPSLHGPWTYLIDGHQRTMTLLSALTPPDPALYDKLDEDDRVRFPVYYDLSEEAFKFRPKRRTLKETWMPLDVLISSEATYEFCKPLYSKGHALEARRAEGLRSRFDDYWIPVIPMVTDDFEAVAVGFQRINNGSTPMTGLHMLHAVIAAKGVDLLARLQEARDKHLSHLSPPEKSPELDDQILAAAKLAMGFGIYEQDPEKLAETLAESVSEIDRAAYRLARAAKLLGELCGVKDLAAVPYKYQPVLTTLVFGSQRLKIEPTDLQKQRIVEWFWRTSFLESFAGISEGRLNQVTREMRSMLEDPGSYKWPSWLEGEVEGPSSPKESGRLRALRALLALRGGPAPDLLEQYQTHPEEAPSALVDAERAKVEEVGLKYIFVARKGAKARSRADSVLEPRPGWKVKLPMTGGHAKPAAAPRPRGFPRGYKLT